MKMDLEKWKDYYKIKYIFYRFKFIRRVSNHLKWDTNTLKSAIYTQSIYYV